MQYKNHLDIFGDNTLDQFGKVAEYLITVM